MRKQRVILLLIGMTLSLTLSCLPIEGGDDLSVVLVNQTDRRVGVMKEGASDLPAVGEPGPSHEVWRHLVAEPGGEVTARGIQPAPYGDNAAAAIGFAAIDMEARIVIFSRLLTYEELDAVNWRVTIVDQRQSAN